jgi:hypothetical protein
LFECFVYVRSADLRALRYFSSFWEHLLCWEFRSIWLDRVECGKASLSVLEVFSLLNDLTCEVLVLRRSFECIWGVLCSKASDLSYWSVERIIWKHSRCIEWFRDLTWGTRVWEDSFKVVEGVLRFRASDLWGMVVENLIWSHSRHLRFRRIWLEHLSAKNDIWEIDKSCLSDKECKGTFEVKDIFFERIECL